MCWPEGDFSASAKADGYADVGETVLVEGAARGTRRLAVTLKLAKGLAVAGRVVFPDGKPAPGVTIYVSYRGSTSGNPAGTTDKDGRFRVAGLPDGPVRVSAILDPFTDEERGRSSESRAGVEDLEIVLPLPRGR